jgi:hypothetical protein
MGHGHADVFQSIGISSKSLGNTEWSSRCPSYGTITSNHLFIDHACFISKQHANVNKLEVKWIDSD